LVMERSDNGMRAVADEIADDIWALVDSIRAEAGVPMTRQDEMRILAIRRKLTHRLASATGYRDRGESAPPKKRANLKDSLADRQDGILLRHSHRADPDGQHT
jgi:hypothetical protein